MNWKLITVTSDSYGRTETFTMELPNGHLFRVSTMYYSKGVAEAITFVPHAPKAEGVYR